VRRRYFAPAAPWGTYIPVDRGFSAPGVNLDGIVFEGPRQLQQDHTGYVQLFRNGCVELVGTDFLFTVDGDRSGIIEPSMYEFPLVRLDVPTIAQTLASMGIPAPAYVFVSLTEIHRRLVDIRQSGGTALTARCPISLTTSCHRPCMSRTSARTWCPSCARRSTWSGTRWALSKARPISRRTARDPSALPCPRASLGDGQPPALRAAFDPRSRASAGR
jgi:hypothetical protein